MSVLCCNESGDHQSSRRFQPLRRLCRRRSRPHCFRLPEGRPLPRLRPHRPEYCKRKALAGSRQLRVRWCLAGDRPAGGSDARRRADPLHAAHSPRLRHLRLGPPRRKPFPAGSLRRKPHPPCLLTESEKSGRSFKKRPDLSFGFNEKRRVTAPRSWKRPDSPSKPSYPPAQSGKPHRLHPAWDWVLPSPQSSRSGRRAAPTYSYKRWGC